MPDKLTDNEIIKALECCSEANNCGQCEYEPTEHQIGSIGRSNELMKNALDLINRLQAENENYSKNNQTMTSDILKLYKELEQAKAEIEQLEKDKENLAYSLANAVGKKMTAKAEAYKEFAEKLHEQLRVYGIKDKFNKAVFLNIVDKAKKELVGEDK